MKKTLSLLVGAALFFTSVFPASVHAGAYGDINADGSIDASDALMALQHSVQLITLSTDDLIWADVSGDGAVDSVDALQIYSIRWD